MLNPIRPSLRVWPVFLALALGASACGKADAPDTGPAAKAPATGASSAGAPATRDWAQTVVATEAGGFRMGNPDAPVKLLEFASFTCGHCQRFHLEAVEALKSGLIRSGRVSYEYRPFLLNPIDLAAALVAVCNGPEQFFAWADHLYRDHDSWITPFTKLSDADLKSLNALPQDQQVKRLAELGGLDAFVRPRGMPRARFDQCLSNPDATRQILETQRVGIEQYQVASTPTLLLNGKKLDGITTWSDLRPRIEALLK